MPASHRYHFLVILILVPLHCVAQCIPWQDSSASVSISQLKVPAKAHRAFVEVLSAVQKRDERGARSAVVKALKIEPRYAPALTMSGLFALQDSRLQDAERDIKASIEADPRYYGAYLALAAVENARRNYEEGERLARSVSTHCANFWWTYYEEAKALIGRRQYAAALAVLRDGTTQASYQNPLLRIPRACALAALNQDHDAIHELEVFLRESSDKRVGLEEVRSKLQALRSRVALQPQSGQQDGAMGTE
jgi:hypothetical protein